MDTAPHSTIGTALNVNLSAAGVDGGRSRAGRHAAQAGLGKIREVEQPFSRL
jgi:hypothetical protein